jgi:sec-independent protein translocase protein TatB
MFEIGWTELLVVAIVLIVVVGPKDLPPMLRAFGKMTSKMRAMAGEFRGQFDEALREAELDDVKKTLNEARNLNPMNQIKDAMNPLKAAGDDIRSNLEKSVKTDPKPDPAPAEQPAVPKVEIPTPPVALADGPPVIAAPKAEPTAAAGKPTPPGKRTAATPAKTPAAKATAKAAAPQAAAKPVAAKPVAAAKPQAAKPAVAAKTAKPAAPKARKSTKDTA